MIYLYKMHINPYFYPFPTLVVHQVVSEPIKPCIWEESNVTTPSILLWISTPLEMMMKNLFVLKLICQHTEVQDDDVDDVKIIHDEIKDSKSLLEDVKESFQTIHSDFIIPP